MAAEINTKLRVDLVGNLPAQAGRYEAALGGFVGKSQAHLSRLGRVTATVGAGLDKVVNRWTLLAAGAAGAAAGRQVVALETRFTRLGIQANKTTADMDRLRDAIFDVARAADIRVDPGEITAAIEEIVEKTGDLAFAEANIRNIGAAISATGAAGANIGAIMAEFQKMGLVDPTQVLEALDTLNRQGKEGAFTLANLAALGPRVVTAYTAMGRSGTEALREMGAALQVIRQGTGSSEMAATALEAVLRTLGDVKKVGLLKDLGIQVFDAEALKEGREVMRSLPTLMEEIIRATGGAKTQLSEIFDAEAVRAFNAAASEFQRSGAVTSLERFMAVQGDGAATMADSARAAQDLAAALAAIRTSWQRFAATNLAGPIRDLAAALDQLSPEEVDRWIKVALYGIGALGALGAVSKVAKTITAVRGAMAGGGTAGTLAGAAAGGVGGPVPVFVTNWGGAGAGATAGAGGAGKAARLAKGALAVTGAGAAGYMVGSEISDRYISGTQLGDAIGEGVAKALAAFGNREAADAVAATRAARQAAIAQAAAAPQVSGMPNQPMTPAVERAIAEAQEAKAAADRARIEGVDAATQAKLEAEMARTMVAAEMAKAQARADAAEAASNEAVVRAEAAAATVAKGIHGTVRIEVTGPGRVTSVQASGPVDIEADTGRVMTGN